jgi:multimeric flavodoxin WrbA
MKNELSMKITLVDGSPENYSKSDFTIELASDLIEEGHTVNLLKTATMKINYCNGCWSCWWKTPGECPQHDDMPEIYKSYLNSDLVIHYSPMVAGFVSSKLKTVNDRSVPLVHPYIRIVNKECHHLGRYDKYPKMALIVAPEDADSEDLSITEDLYRRLAINLKSELKLFTTTLKPKEELINEINHI